MVEIILNLQQNGLVDESIQVLEALHTKILHLAKLADIQRILHPETEESADENDEITEGNDLSTYDEALESFSMLCTSAQLDPAWAKHRVDIYNGSRVNASSGVTSSTEIDPGGGNPQGVVAPSISRSKWTLQELLLFEAGLVKFGPHYPAKISKHMGGSRTREQVRERIRREVSRAASREASREVRGASARSEEAQDETDVNNSDPGDTLS